MISSILHHSYVNIPNIEKDYINLKPCNSTYGSKVNLSYASSTRQMVEKPQNNLTNITQISKNKGGNRNKNMKLKPNDDVQALISDNRKKDIKTTYDANTNVCHEKSNSFVSTSSGVETGAGSEDSEYSYHYWKPGQTSKLLGQNLGNDIDLSNSKVKSSNSSNDKALNKLNANKNNMGSGTLQYLDVIPIAYKKEYINLPSNGDSVSFAYDDASKKTPKINGRLNQTIPLSSGSSTLDKNLSFDNYVKSQNLSQIVSQKKYKTPHTNVGKGKNTNRYSIMNGTQQEMVTELVKGSKFYSNKVSTNHKRNNDKNKGFYDNVQPTTLIKSTSFPNSPFRGSEQKNCNNKQKNVLILDFHGWVKRVIKKSFSAQKIPGENDRFREPNNVKAVKNHYVTGHQSKKCPKQSCTYSQNLNTSIMSENSENGIKGPKSRIRLVKSNNNKLCLATRVRRLSLSSIIPSAKNCYAENSSNNNNNNYTYDRRNVKNDLNYDNGVGEKNKHNVFSIHSKVPSELIYRIMGRFSYHEIDMAKTEALRILSQHNL